MEREIQHRTVDVEGDGTEIRLHVASGGPHTGEGILLLHEKRGVDVHTRHVADRLVEQNYTVFVPDLLSRYGRSRRGAVPTARGIPAGWHVDDLLVVCERIVEAYRFSALGCLGYSFGGELAIRLADRYGGIQALVTYYSRPSEAEWSRVDVPVLAIYAEADDQLDRLGAARGALSSDPSPVLVQRFSGPRAFENPHRPDRYREESAREAWRLTVDWFNHHLRDRQPASTDTGQDTVDQGPG